MGLFGNRLKSAVLQDRELAVSERLPFAYLEEDGFVRTKHGDYLAVLKVEGVAWDTLEDDVLNLEQDLRAQLFASVTDPQFAVYHTMIRSRAHLFLESHYDLPVAACLHADYQKQLERNPLFANELYLVLVLKGEGSQGNRVSSRFRQWLVELSYGLSSKRAERGRQESVRLLGELVLRFLAGLDHYRIRKLGLYKGEEGGIYSEQLRFFSRILNWDDAPMQAVESDVSVYLSKRRLFFGSRAIESVDNQGHCRFAAMLSLKEYPANTFPGMLDRLLSLPIELVISQSFVFEHPQSSREELELQLRRLRQSRDPDRKGIEQLEYALGSVVSGEYGFGYHHLTVMMLADDLETLDQHVATVDKRLSETGIVGVREQLNMEAAFWAQFPGNFNYIARKMLVTTANFASLCSLNNDPVGHPFGNHWGEAVTLLKTPSNLPYYFNFHKPGSDVGHSLIIGMSGSGKTLLTCFLLHATLKYGARIFYFDKDHGAEAFMRAMGADYSILGGGESTGLNPLQLPDTARNRHFLVDWLGSLVTAFGERLTTEDRELISEAVRLNYERLEPQQRTLHNLAEAFGHPGQGSLRARIDPWHKEGELGEFFGAKTDQLRLDGRCYCFEMGPLLERGNAVALSSVLLYLFHRIELALDEATAHVPTIICLDEAWALLSNPIFSVHIKDWLKTFRKRNAIVLLLSQELMDIGHSEISATINAETVTKIFFADSSPMKEVYRDVFHLSDREIDLLKEYSSSRRYFLVKQPQESVFVTLDLAGLTQWIPLLSGNSQTVALLHELIRVHGPDPAVWVPIYLERARNA